MRRSLVTLAVVALLLLSACSGPRSPIEVSMRRVPTNVLLGIGEPPASEGPVEPAVASVPPGLYRPGDGPLVTLDVAPREQGAIIKAPVPRSAACPEVDPLAPPTLEAPRTIPGRPVVATYPGRLLGSYALEGRTVQGGKSSGTFPAQETRQIKDVGPGAAAGSFVFTTDEHVPALNYTIRTRFYVDATGIYLAGLDFVYSTGFVDSFTSAVPTAISLLTLPVEQRAVVGGRAVHAGIARTDPTYMSLTGVVEGKQRVDACGVPLDSWSVAITAGEIKSRDRQVKFVGQYFFGTQFGGIPLGDGLQISCDSPFSGCYYGSDIALTKAATINVEPRRPEKGT